MDIIGSKIRTLRKNKNLTQEELAEVLSVSPQAISKWENGQSVHDIEKEFGVKVFSIVTFEDIINTMKSGVISAEQLEKMMHYKEEYGNV